ncbi:CrcB protein [Cryobacterium mesophilum]|uniref:Fluoride-specific ion channel FluC n=1 Tax=Terrimesophilobacter mesophilus TaxID=433647 RepID=A0A4R8VBH0_9MICO|nr:CrcB family protein [Terrimesophilobacter mesophilus]MBB5632955.1 CrcB protein [Terrimesophilobacter mesophilus]TFB79726.1 chromosome condensation protein CrcB [Terrimesophilobacter mesophilus]
MTLFPLLVAAAGGIGAALRLALNGVIHRRVRPEYPIAMTIINVSGSFALGFLTGLLEGRMLPQPWAIALGAGLVGGFTAFSTTSFHTLRLVQEKRWWAAVANSFGMLALAVIVAGLGLWLGWML